MDYKYGQCVYVDPYERLYPCLYDHTIIRAFAVDEKGKINIDITGEELANEGTSSNVFNSLYWVATMMGIKDFLFISQNYYPFDTIVSEICLSVLTFMIAQSRNCDKCTNTQFAYGSCKIVRIRNDSRSCRIMSLCDDCSREMAKLYDKRFELVADVQFPHFFPGKGVVYTYGKYRGRDMENDVRTIGKWNDKKVKVPPKVKGPRLSRAQQKQRKRLRRKS